MPFSETKFFRGAKELALAAKEFALQQRILQFYIGSFVLTALCGGSALLGWVQLVRGNEEGNPIFYTELECDKTNLVGKEPAQVLDYRLVEGGGKLEEFMKNLAFLEVGTKVEVTLPVQIKTGTRNFKIFVVKTADVDDPGYHPTNLVDGWIVPATTELGAGKMSEEEPVYFSVKKTSLFSDMYPNLDKEKTKVEYQFMFVQSDGFAILYLLPKTADLSDEMYCLTEKVHQVGASVFFENNHTPDYQGEPHIYTELRIPLSTVKFDLTTLQSEIENFPDKSDQMRVFTKSHGELDVVNQVYGTDYPYDYDGFGFTKDGKIILPRMRTGLMAVSITFSDGRQRQFAVIEMGRVAPTVLISKIQPGESISVKVINDVIVVELAEDQKKIIVRVEYRKLQTNFADEQEDINQYFADETQRLVERDEDFDITKLESAWDFFQLAAELEED